MYVKTQWVDNTTPIDKNNLNKIEQGIYDNSLITEAIADKLNPTDTETYKTAELTEGQITDVIGVKDIIIKGQTEQDGTPTPSAPVDVNVVSGSNVINTRNMEKNLLNINDIQVKSESVSIDDKNYITYTLNNSSGSSNVFANLVFNVDKNIVKGQTYYLVVEIKSISGNGTMYFNHYGSGFNTVQFTPNTNQQISALTTQKYKYTLVANTNEIINQGLRTYLMCSAGQSASITCRYSILKNNVTNLNNFVYEPYQGKELPLDLGSIELCKIGNYQDYFYKSGSKWYLHKEIGKVVLDGVNYKASTKSGTTANIMYTTNNIIGIKPVSSNSFLGNLMTSHFKNTTTDTIYSGDVIGIGQRTNEQISIGLGLSSTLTTLELFNAWLALNNVKLYYILQTATNTEITGTLKEQLEAIYNAPLYEQTNITQTNNDLPMVLDITACKDNINGIKAFIRK